MFFQVLSRLLKYSEVLSDMIDWRGGGKLAVS